MATRKSSGKRGKSRKAKSSATSRLKMVKLTQTQEPEAVRLRSAIADILGRTPTEITVKLSPGGARAGDGSWDGNIYKYRY